VSRRRAIIVLDVCVELLQGGQDHWSVIGDVPVEHLLDVIGPAGKQGPVFAWCAQQGADDRNGVVAGDVADHVAAPDLGERVDEFGDDLNSQGAQPFGAAWCERLGDEPPEPVVRVAVEAQDAGDCPVPQWARGDALQVKAESGCRDETGVAQHGAHQLVAQYFWRVGAHRDRRLLACRGDDAVRLEWVVLLQVVNPGQPGVKNARAGAQGGGLDGHSGLRRFGFESTIC
jgi:hypothetical protein